MSIGDGAGDGFRRTGTPFSRIVNPELYAKPNLTVGLMGTTVFVVLLSNFWWQRHSMEKQREVRLKNAPKPVEVLHQDD